MKDSSDSGNSPSSCATQSEQQNEQEALILNSKLLRDTALVTAMSRMAEPWTKKPGIRKYHREKSRAAFCLLR